METGIVTKRRFIFKIEALRLLREQSCIDYARRSVPSIVDGVRIEFPDAKASVGLYVTLRSRRLVGNQLLPLLYDRQYDTVTVHLGMSALKALQTAEISSDQFRFFGRTYGLARKAKLMVDEILGTSLLSQGQRRVFGRLATDYLTQKPDRIVLVHSDLQATHLIVNLVENTLGMIDLEAMRFGKAATNFAQLWEAFYFADPQLGRRLYECYIVQCHEFIDSQFDADVKAELALRCHSHVQSARRRNHQELENKARTLLVAVLSDSSFEQICT